MFLLETIMGLHILLSFLLPIKANKSCFDKKKKKKMDNLQEINNVIKWLIIQPNVFCLLLFLNVCGIVITAIG